MKVGILVECGRMGLEDIICRRICDLLQAERNVRFDVDIVPMVNKALLLEDCGTTVQRRVDDGCDRVLILEPLISASGYVRSSGVPSDPRSTLFNTDGQIFSDAGVPCVLFMENYDIDRTGYHDTHDTMENIDLDCGAAVCAITIEAVARAANSQDSPLCPRLDKGGVAGFYWATCFPEYAGPSRPQGAESAARF